MVTVLTASEQINSFIPIFPKWTGELITPHSNSDEFSLNPDIHEADRFLTALDEEAVSFTFQTFDDNKYRKDKCLASILHGSLEQHFHELRQLNNQGAGIFVTVQKTNGHGRGRNDIERVRAFFQDDDGEGKPLPLEPHIEVETSLGKYQRYLLCEGITLNEFDGIQQRIIDDYGSDPAAAGINRVFRVPGFYHRKSIPQFVRLLTTEPILPYTREKIMEALPPVCATPKTALRLGIEHDLILKGLDKRGLILRTDTHGKWELTCPWADEHTTGSGGAVYFEPHTGGYDRAAFKCLHTHCVKRNISDLKQFLCMEEAHGDIILPSDHVPFKQAATNIFSLFAESYCLFVRGTSIAVFYEGNLVIITPQALRSLVEQLGPTKGHIRHKDKWALTEKRLSTESAKALLETREACKLLPPLRVVTTQPVITEVNGQPVTLDPGYHPVNGGILIQGTTKVPEVPLTEAAKSLKGLLQDFDFVSPGDESRALAAFITPALKIGNLLNRPAPIDIAEADQSQAGKTLRQSIVRAVYGEQAYPVGRRVGGVGSMDESLSQALLSGRPFITMDNVRGRVDSQFLEMILTWNGRVPVRVPHRGEVKVDAGAVNYQMTSNGIETTPDLANRSSVVRIRKRPPGYHFHQWLEGDIIEHITQCQAYYLGCVHAVVAEWIKQGKPRTNGGGHDLRVWAGMLDWITQNLFGAAPLMQGHREVQERVSNRALIWLRAIGHAVIKAGREDALLCASEIFEVGELEGIDMPGATKELDEKRGRQRVGQLLGQAFKRAGTDRLEIDGVVVYRSEDSYQDADHGMRTRRVYAFRGEDNDAF
ncbi:MAG: DNA-primase RepB domain-containing protein [Candidatus Sedimenticola sp. (ex Thyasira tokunagai)]